MKHVSKMQNSYFESIIVNPYYQLSNEGGRIRGLRMCRFGTSIKLTRRQLRPSSFRKTFASPLTA